MNSRGKSFRRQLLSGAALAFAIKILGVFVSFVFLLVMAKSMSSYAFGVLAACLSVAQFLGPAGALGQQTAILRFWPSLEEIHGRDVAALAIRRSIWLAGLGALVVTLAGGAAALAGLRLEAFGTEPTFLLFAAILAAAWTTSDVTSSALRAQGDIVWAMAPKEVLWRGSVIVIVVLTGMEITAGEALALVAAILLMVSVFQFLRVVASEPRIFAFRKLSPVLPREELEAMRYSQWGFWGNTILNGFQREGATVIVALFLGPLEAGMFFAASRLASLLSIFQFGMVQVVSPMLARSWRAQKIDEVRRIVHYTTALSIVVSFAGFLVLTIWGDWLLSLFDTDYQAGYLALVILAGAHLLDNSCGPGGSLLLMSGNERYLVGVRLMSALVQIVTLAVLIPWFGLVGAAIAYLLSIIAWNFAALAKVYFGLGVPPLCMKKFLGR